MIRKLLTRLKLYFHPPKSDDVFWADSFEFMAGKPFEHVLHGLRNRNGDATAEPMHGKDTYRMKIKSDTMPYYIIQCEVLATNVNTHEKAWFFRSQPRRIWKTAFSDMIVEGSVSHEQL